MADVNNITIKAKRRIKKFAEGADPNVDEPFEVLEKEEVLVGEDAIKFLEQMGGKVDASN